MNCMARHCVTLALLGLGGVLGGGLVVAWGDHGQVGRGGGEPTQRLRSGAGRVGPEPHPIRGWQKGKGWGWIWGKDDEVGSLNALSNQSRAAALALATRGEVFDLGMTYSRRSYKLPATAPARSSRSGARTACTG